MRTKDFSILLEPAFTTNGTKDIAYVDGTNSIVQQNTKLSNAVIADSMIGSHATYEGMARDLSMGDYSSFKE